MYTTRFPIVILEINKIVRIILEMTELNLSQTINNVDF